MSSRILLYALLLAWVALASGCDAAPTNTTNIGNANTTNRNTNTASTASAPGDANVPPATTTGAPGGATTGASATPMNSNGETTATPRERASKSVAVKRQIEELERRREEDFQRYKRAEAIKKRSPKEAAESSGDDSGDEYSSVPNYQNYPTRSFTPAPTPQAGVSPALPSPTPHGDSVDAYLDSLPRGEVAFNTPEKMLLEQSVNVEVKLGREHLAGKLEELIREDGKTESHPLKVAKVMEAQLAGAGFEIIPVTPAEQPVSDSAPTEWEWQMKAKREGKQRLHLTLAAVVTVNGKERRRKLDTFKKDILVEVTSGSRIAAFFYDNMSWLVPVLVLPVLGGLSPRLWRLIRRRGGQPQPPPAP